MLKYAAIFISIAEHDDSRAEYIGIVSRPEGEMRGGGELAGLALEKGGCELEALESEVESNDSSVRSGRRGR
jgi:hypothetical protein